VSQELLEKYKTEEKKELVRLRQRQPLHFPRIIMRDLVNEHDFIRHDPIKISRLIDDFTQGWIK
jgi:hypothetical protein